MGFDPEQYKATTRQQWEGAAEAWQEWGPTIEEWLGEATEIMLDAGAVAPGCRVLDVAAGTGGQILVAARRVGPSGDVVATAQCLRLERQSFGALHQMLAGVVEDERPQVWDRIEQALARFETSDGFEGPCELLVGAGTR